MASNSNPRSPSSEPSRSRKRLVIEPGDTTRARYSSLEDSIVGKGTRTSASARKPVPGDPKSAGRRVAGSKAEERSIRLSKQRRGGRLRILVAVVAGVAVIAGAVWLYRSPAFRVKRVDVVGVRRLTAAQVRSLAKVPRDATLLRLPAAEIEARLAKSPWISAAEVTRDFPDGVRIRVTERSPLALVTTSGKARWLVDKTGVWLAPQSMSATSALIVVRDVTGLDPVAGRKTQSETLINALEVISQLDSTMSSATAEVSAPSIDKTALVTKNDVEVFVGPSDDIGRKLQVAEQILKDQAGKVVYINVRTVDRPTWRGLEQDQ